MNKIENLEILLKLHIHVYIYVYVYVKRDLRSWKCLRNLNSQTNS